MTPALPDTILIAREPGETWFALLSGDEVIELAVTRDLDVQPGAVYLGRAGKRLGAVGCFVELGNGSPGYLQARTGLPAEGRLVRVKIVSAATADKGPTLALLTPSADLDGAPRQITAAPTPAEEWATLYGAAIHETIGTGADVARHAGPSLAHLTRQRGDLFEDRGVNDAVEAALAPTSPLTDGGSVIFERTAAAVVIDVNAGGGDIDVANRAAMAVIGRHLRLRNLSGHILIDLIPSKQRAAHRDALSALVSADPVPTQISGFTPLGMLELTRQRRRPGLAELMLDGALPSARATAFRALRRATRAAAAMRTASVRLTLATAPANMLAAELSMALKEAEQTASCTIHVVANPAFTGDRIETAA